MSTIKVDEIFGDQPTDAVDLPNKLKVGGVSAEQGYTASGSEPSSPSNGDFWWDTGNDKLYRYIDGGFKELGIAPPPSVAWGGARGFAAGGMVDYGNYRNEIDYWDMANGGTAQDFGDLTVNGFDSPVGMSNGVRCVFAPRLSNGTNETMDYITCATTGNATDFGDPAVGRGNAAASNGTRGIMAGDTSPTNTICYITIANTGNTTDHGDMLDRYRYGCATGDLTTCLFFGGNYRPTSGGTTYLNDIFKINFMTTGNASDWGYDLINRPYRASATSDATRGIIAGGIDADDSYNNSDTIQYVTIATAAAATDFGNLLSATGGYNSAMGCSNGVLGVFAGWFSSSVTDNIQKITIQTTANATSHGNLSFARLNAGNGAGNAS